MEELENDFHDEMSSFEDILDFELPQIEVENDQIIDIGKDDFYYRHLDEY